MPKTAGGRTTMPQRMPGMRWRTVPAARRQRGTMPTAGRRRDTKTTSHRAPNRVSHRCRGVAGRGRARVGLEQGLVVGVLGNPAGVARTPVDFAHQFGARIPSMARGVLGRNVGGKT